MSIKTKNLETEQQRLKISREGEYARQEQEQEQEIAVCRAEQEADIAEEEAQKKREAEEAKIAAGRAVDLKRIAAECDIKKRRHQKNKSSNRQKSNAAQPSNWPGKAAHRRGRKISCRVRRQGRSRQSPRRRALGSEA